jgi:hypothetical protein
MAMNAQRTVVGVFDERAGAEDAIEDLQNAGFSSDQIYYSGSDEDHREDRDTGFWQGITRFFTHAKDTPHDPFAQQLRDLGLSDDEIRRYDDEYHNGRTLVAVKASDREEEALAVLRINGAHG